MLERRIPNIRPSNLRTFQRLIVFAPKNRIVQRAHRSANHRAGCQRAKSPGLLDRALSLEIEREVAGPPDELQIGHRAVTMHKERHLGLERRALPGPLPPAQHLRHDVLQILGERKCDTLGAHGGDVVARRRLLAGQWLRRRCCPRRRFAPRLILRRRWRGARHGALWPLGSGDRRRFFLRGPLERLGRLAGLQIGGRRGNQPHAIRRREPRASSGCAEQQHDHQPVNDERSRDCHAYGGWSAAASSHRLIVSGSATSPTSWTPAPRITASTCTTRA